MSEQNALATSKQDALSQMLGFKTVSIKELSEEEKKVLRDTVARDTTDSELAFFLNVSLAQDLNPFLKEVWSIKYDGKLTIQTGRDGYLKIAKRDPQFDSIQSAEVREGDHFTMDTVTGAVEHRMSAKRGAILGAYAIITRKDGKKLVKYVSFSEYKGSSPIWNKFPTPMICKCAESAICRQFANITGIMAEELMAPDGTEIGSPDVQEEQSNLKDSLIEAIEACETIEDLTNLKQTIAGSLGKLFQTERDAVMEVAKKRSAALKALDRTPVEVKKEPEILDAEIVEPKTEQTKMPIDEPTPERPFRRKAA